MNDIRIVLSGKHFEQLVKGQEVQLGETQPIRIILSDIGFAEMARILRETIETFTEPDDDA